MKREKILEVLRSAGRPMTLSEISQQTGIELSRLRVDLFRLMNEGKVERRQRGMETTWTIKVSTPLEKRYEKLSQKYVP